MNDAHDASCEEVEDGLGIWRGITAALVIEAGAVGIVWAVWQAAPIVAAWWRAR